MSAASVQSSARHGRSVLLAGIQTLPCSLGMVIASPYAGRIAARYGFRVVVSLGLALAGTGLVAMSAVHHDAGYGSVWWRLAIIGAAVVQARQAHGATFATALNSAFLIAGAVTAASAIFTALWLGRKDATGSVAPARLDLPGLCLTSRDDYGEGG